MINFNKFLMNRHRFPYPAALSLAHMVFASVLAPLLFRARPSLFPTMLEKSSKIDRRLIVSGALPIAALFSTQLVLSNAAYLHCSIAFLQMMKESNLVWVYILSLVFSMEVFSTRNAVLLGMTLFATSLSVRGEINFSHVGFMMQATSQLFESSKIVLQSVLLSPGRGWKLDPLTYVLVVMPLCAICLCMTLSSMVVFWPNRPSDFMLPSFAEFHSWWPYILASCCVSFTLNVVVASFVRSTGAVAFILAGVIKDIIIVSSSSLIMGDTVSGMQALAFTLQISLVVTWSFLKQMPDQFEDGFLRGVSDLFLDAPPKTHKGRLLEKMHLLKEDDCKNDDA
jgi:hypothetical protein